MWFQHVLIALIPDVWYAEKQEAIVWCVSCSTYKVIGLKQLLFGGRVIVLVLGAKEAILTLA